MPRLDIALTPRELDAYLGSQRTIRLATATPEGVPQVVPLWFVWLDGTVFMNTTIGNVTVRNLDVNPWATGSVDDGETYDDLRGALVHGRVERADGDSRLTAVETAWSAKYLGGNPVPFGQWKGRTWLRMVPDRVASWDFRKIPEARARRRRGAASQKRSGKW